MIVNDIRVIWPKLAKIGFYCAGRAQKWNFLKNFCSGLLVCSFGMKKWTNKFYRDSEGQAKIGCSSLWAGQNFKQGTGSPLQPSPAQNPFLPRYCAAIVVRIVNFGETSPRSARAGTSRCLSVVSSYCEATTTQFTGCACSMFMCMVRVWIISYDIYFLNSS